MTLERRDEAAPAPEERPSPAGSGGKKPVIVYIFVLFIVAFLLMALSLLIHQRSNAEALGALSESVNAMQGAQGTQEKIIALQEQLAEVQEALIQSDRDAEALAQAAAAGKSAAEKAQERLDALTALYTLQQRWSAGDIPACRELIGDMERRDTPSLLDTTAQEGVTPPAERYLELKEAVEALEDRTP